MSLKCVHKGCGKKFSDPEEPCTYHRGPPIFHEGQKGWRCCKPRVLTFDEFLSIPPCTTGKHSTVDETPAPASAPAASIKETPAPAPRLAVPVSASDPHRAQQPQAPSMPEPPAQEPESEDDDPTLPIPSDTACRRRACGVRSTAATASSREGEECVFHPGHPIFHEGTKGWTCCKRRVLEFDEFMRMKGCVTKERHMFVGSGKKGGKGAGGGEERVESVKHDFYQTPSTIHASLFLKKISKADAKVSFSSSTALDLDLPTSDNKRYQTTMPLFGAVDTEKSTWKIMGTKIELTLVKAEGGSWPVLRADERRTGEIIQVGGAGRA